MHIDPRISFALNLTLMIMSGLATGAVHFTGLVPDPVAAQIIGWAGIATFVLSSVNTALHGYSSATPGPWAAPDAPKTPVPPLGGKIMLLLAASTIAALMTVGASSHAEARAFFVSAQKHAPVKLTTPDQIIAKVITWAAADGDADLAAAIQMAKASNDNVTLPCWTALQTFVGQVKTLPPADQLPKLHLATDVEIATDLMIALEPNSPVVTQCQALANFQKMTAINMVTGIVTGALSLGKLAPIIP
ncbi:MAG TPA: hypothetical protein VGG12_03400 [Methylovirgula sp.]